METLARALMGFGVLIAVAGVVVVVGAAILGGGPAGVPPQPEEITIPASEYTGS